MDSIKKVAKDFGNIEKLKKTAKEVAEKALKAAKELGGIASKGAAGAIAGASAGISDATGTKVPGAPSRPPGPVVPARPMKFPYTWTAKLVQFPWVYYIKNNWLFRYYAIAVVICIPVFKKISNSSNSPTNKQKWKEIRDKEREEAHHH